MSAAIDELCDILLAANARTTFDRERSTAKPCFNCGATYKPRTLVVVGYWTRKVGNRGDAGDPIERPMCAECAPPPRTREEPSDDEA